MCTIIVTIRTVLWYVMSLAATLMILVSLFTDRWLHGTTTGSSFTSVEGALDTFVGITKDVSDGNLKALNTRNVGLFPHCTQPEGMKFFEGECIPDWEMLEETFTKLENEENYPHAWRGAILCFVVGLGLMIITDLFALLTVCCRHCLCCSVFTVCGSVQSFASMLFILGLVAYPAGWGSEYVSKTYCAGQSQPFMLGEACSIGIAFWLAVAGTTCTVISSSLAIWAYQSTKSSRAEMRQDEGDRCICVA